MASKKRAIKLHDSNYINIIVSVDHIRGHKIDQVVDMLKSAGMRIEAKFPVTGTIVGEVAVTDLPKIREIDGVASVEEEPSFNIF